MDIESVIDECRTILDKLKSANHDPNYREITATPLLGMARDVLEGKQGDLGESRKQLQTLLQVADQRVAMSSKESKYRAKAEKVSLIHCIVRPCGSFSKLYELKMRQWCEMCQDKFLLFNSYAQSTNNISSEIQRK